MGFGILFIGYFMATLMSINAIGSVMRLIGYSIVLIATRKIYKYNRTFALVSLTSVAMIIISILLVMYDGTQMLYEQMIIGTMPFPASFRTVVGYVEMGASFVFNASLLYAVRRIALETEVTKIAIAAVRNFIFICVYYVMMLIGSLPFEFVKGYASAFGAPVLILYFVWIILNLVLIYSCYARICDESDVDMIQKPSRFEFVNKMRRESEQRRLNADQKYAERKKQKKERRK